MSTRSRRGVVALLSVAALAGMAGCAQGEAEASIPIPVASATTPVATTPEAQPSATLPREPQPLPSVQEDGEATCDYMLSRGRDEFVAVVYLINTGDAPGSAEVIATWKQANGKHIHRSQTVDVPVDKPVEVYLSAIASGSQISLHQALPLDKRCSFEVNVKPKAAA